MDFVNTLVYGWRMDEQVTRDRLTRTAWLDHGLRILARLMVEDEEVLV